MSEKLIQCEECGEEHTVDDCPEDKPSRIPCSYPGCDKLTTWDVIYGDLCYRHIRADNE